jgi:outer membrane protein assembly factor BamA
MLRERKYCLWLLVAFACCHSVSAQVPLSADKPLPNSPLDSLSAMITRMPAGEGTPFRVRNIIIEGNKRTRSSIILREIPFKPGEPYMLQVLVNKFEDARRQLMNTTLFLSVVVALKSFDGYDIDVLVQVKERWYLFPVPFFKPVDRNLNQWIVEQKASLSRVNYGAKLLYYNTTGRNDKLRAWAINGYTKQLSFSYSRPYIDNKLKWGLTMGFALGKNKEMNYNTIKNKQVFLKDEKYVRNFMNFSAEATYRKAIKTWHRIGIGYNTEEVSDSVVKLNPNYFSRSQRRIAFPEIYYTMTYIDLDYIPYPTKGYAAEINIGKRGVNRMTNLWQLNVKGAANWTTGKRSFVSVAAIGNIKLPFKQSYFNQRALGYGSLSMQGYEYYVVDGVAAGVLKSAYTRKLVTFNVKVPTGKKRDPLRIPINIYGKVFGNTGYVHNPQPGDNFLTNKMLYSGGFGIDIITLYDVTIKLEWSCNQLGQNGIFLHRNSIF